MVLISEDSEIIEPKKKKIKKTVKSLTVETPKGVSLYSVNECVKRY